MYDNQSAVLRQPPATWQTGSLGDVNRPMSPVAALTGQTATNGEGLSKCVERLYGLKLRLFGSEPEAVGREALSPPCPSGVIPTLRHETDRQSRLIESLASLLTEFEERLGG